MDVHENRALLLLLLIALAAPACFDWNVGEEDRDGGPDAGEGADGDVDADVGSCGDGRCEGEESAVSCAVDCPASCGDGSCTHDESSASCAEDCPVGCGNESCDGGETPVTCPRDCAAECGDGERTHDEECDGDPPGSCVTGCGSVGTRRCVECLWQTCEPPAETCNGLDDDCDGALDDGFECIQGRVEACDVDGSPGSRQCSTTCSWSACSCEPDCGPPCGDGACETGEDSASCPADCGAGWHLRTTAGPHTTFANIAYDSARQVTVLYTGSATWEWDGVTWTEMSPSGDAPGLSHAAMTFDSNRGVTVLAGSPSLSGFFTYEYDGSSWTEITPAGDRPERRYYHAMAFDSDRGVVVLTGGSEVSGSPISYYHWEWDGTSWVHLSARPGGSRDSRHGLCFDSSRSVTVTASTDYGVLETWEYNGTSWLDRSPATLPEARSGFGMAFDSARGLTLMYGGRGETSGDLDDTWQWNGSAWSEVTTTTRPPEGSDMAMTYDSHRGVMVLFVGWGSETWEYRPPT